MSLQRNLYQPTQALHANAFSATARLFTFLLVLLSCYQQRSSLLMLLLGTSSAYVPHFVQAALFIYNFAVNASIICTVNNLVNNIYPKLFGNSWQGVTKVRDKWADANCCCHSNVDVFLYIPVQKYK